MRDWFSLSPGPICASVSARHSDLKRQIRTWSEDKLVYEKQERVRLEARGLVLLRVKF